MEKTVTQPSSSLRPGQSPDFRQYLQSELIRRCRANPKYSLRAFAKLLGIENSRLSKILRGERPASPKLIPRLGQRLGLGQKEIDLFCQAARLKKAVSGAEETEPSRSYQEISLDIFESIEDWRHFAILELMKVKGFEPELKWMAKALGISLMEARDCLERLQRVGLLEVAKDGSWHDLSDGFSTYILGENKTTYAHQRSQRKLLELASEAIGTVPIDRRDQSSMMMATSASKLAEAKRRITKFRRELCEFLEDSEEKDSVYQLSISLFPLVDTNTRGNP